MPPFLLGESHGDARMGVARLLGLCFAFLFASSVTAANIIDLGPSDYRNFGPSGAHTSQGIRSTFGQQARLPPTISGPTKILPVSRNAVVPYGSIANGARLFTRINPTSAAASAAITALFLGLDWVFDPELDAWAYPGDPTLLDDPNIQNWAGVNVASHIRTSSAESACMGASPITLPGCQFRSVQMTTPTSANCKGVFNTNQDATCAVVTRIGTTCPSPSYYDSSRGGCIIDGEYEVIGDSQLQDLEAQLPSLPPQQVAGAASDIMSRQGAPLSGYQDMPMTGPASVSGPSSTSTSTDPVTGETTVTNTSTQTDLSYGPTTITAADTTTSTTYQNGQETGTTVTTETPGDLSVDAGGGGASGGWPGFCDWATVVCDWLNWTREDPPPEEDLPAIIDDDFYVERDISFGSKSCPEPYQVNLAPFMDTQVSVSFQPLCDFAGLIYYMVMAASYIIAAYISIGVARA